MLTFTTTTPLTVNPSYSILICWLTTTISRFIHCVFTGYPLHMKILIPSPPTLNLPIAIIEHFTNTSTTAEHKLILHLQPQLERLLGLFKKHMQFNIYYVQGYLQCIY